MSTGAAPDQHPCRSTNRASTGTAPTDAGDDPDVRGDAGSTTAPDDDTDAETTNAPVNAAITAHPPTSDRATVDRNDGNRR